MLLDQYGTRNASQVCLTNPTTQKIANFLISEMAEMGLSGIVIDMTDILPNSGATGHVGLINNCFCSSCLKELHIAGWRYGARPFQGKNTNITRLILNLTPTGADHIDVPHVWLRDNDSSSLLLLAETREFITEEDTIRREEAEKVLDYLRARAQVTAKSLRALTQNAKERGLKVAAILGDECFDLSQGSDVQTLAKLEAADEYWLPSVDDFSSQAGMSVLSYLYSRGSYSLNNLFEFIHDADDRIVSSGVESFIQDLLKRLSGMPSRNRLSPSGAFAIEQSENYSGIVGVPLSREDMVRQVEQLAAGTLGQVVPPSVIEQLIATVNTFSMRV